MSDKPVFPSFKSIELEDKAFFTAAMKSYQPEISELTFTNLFIWRSHYRFQWSTYGEWLLILGEDESGIYAMEPVGPPSRRDVTIILLDWLKREMKADRPRIERADARLVAELAGENRVLIEPCREHFDYVYLRSDLVELAGNKYRSKRNHINKLFRSYTFEYAPLDGGHLADCLELQEKWCRERRCDDDLSLLGEWEAVREALTNFDRLDVTGGAVLVDGTVLAFTVGELLNDDMAVIHIEKASADVPGLYAIVNQQCAEQCLADVTYINREQDLGMPNLREAKLSYYPHHLVEKFRVALV